MDRTGQLNSHRVFVSIRVRRSSHQSSPLGGRECPVPKMTGMRFIAEALRGYGVSHVFYVPQMLLESLVEMEGWGIRRIMTHGEKAAAYMADGFARASGRPGVCLAQHVGGSNLAAGLKDAYLAGSPVIAMTGGPVQLARLSPSRSALHRGIRISARRARSRAKKLVYYQAFIIHHHRKEIRTCALPNEWPW